MIPKTIKALRVDLVQTNEYKNVLNVFFYSFIKRFILASVLLMDSSVYLHQDNRNQQNHFSASLLICNLS